MRKSEAKEKAALSLQVASYSPAKLALIHTGASAAVALVITVINFLLDQNMGPGGLAGMDTRAMLQTVQMVLTTAYSILTPFWAMGLVRAMLLVSRQENAKPEDLLEGFGRFWPTLRLMLLEGLLYFVVAMACLNIATTIFTFTSMSDSMYAQLESIAAGMTTGQLILDNDQIMALLPSMIPAYVIFGILFFAVAIPLVYRFRMAQYVLMDQKHTGALAAMVLSARMMKGHRLELFRMDLGYWWYYGLQLVITLVAYLGALLPIFGIKLPLDSTAMMFVSFGVQVVLQLLVAYKWLAPVQTSYACAYDILKEEMPPLPTAPQPPQNPWKNEE